MKSPKQLGLETEIRSRLDGSALKAADILLEDQEIQQLQEYANVVSIKRLGYNDHGPVHMRRRAQRPRHGRAHARGRTSR